MTKSKLFSIITIACFVSILCIPLGIVLMIYYTSWKKKTKIIITVSLTAFYAALFAFFFLIKPAYNTKGIGLPFSSNSGYTSFDTGTAGPGKASGKSSTPSKRLQSGQSKTKGKNNAVYPILFFLFMLFLIIWTNIRAKGKTGYENPYVDTNKYKLPLTPDSKMPMVHFLRVELAAEEKLNFATETNQKDNEGNFAITSSRVIIMNKTQNIEFPVSSVTAVSSATSTVMVITADEKKHYVFMPENQMKYAIAVLKWTKDKSHQ